MLQGVCINDEKTMALKQIVNTIHPLLKKMKSTRKRITECVTQTGPPETDEVGVTVLIIKFLPLNSFT